METTLSERSFVIQHSEIGKCAVGGSSQGNRKSSPSKEVGMEQSDNLLRGHREVPPTRRKGYNQKIRIGGTAFYIRTDNYADGRLAEVWIDCAKAGSALRAMLSAVAMSISLGLQHGTPLEVYVKAYKDFGFLPDGFVEGDKRITKVASVLDYLARELEATYLQVK